MTHSVYASSRRYAKSPYKCAEPSIATGMQFAWRSAEGYMSIGQSIVIKGDMSASEDLVIAGRVEGSITLDGRVLTLAPGAEVEGQVAAATVIVSGRIVGTLEASDRLEIRSTATVEGDVTTPTLIVAEGSLLDARVAMPSVAANRATVA